MKYNVLRNRDSILEAIRSGNRKDESFLWQSYIGEKVVIKFSHLEIDETRDLLRLKLKELDKIKTDLPVYIKLGHRNTIFKGFIKLIKNDMMYFDLPSEVQLSELREFERFEIKIPKKKNNFININSPFISGNGKKIPILIEDVSQSGIGAYVRAEDQDELVELTKQMSLSELGDVKFLQNIGLEIIHSRPIETRDNSGLFKIGIRFDNIIPKDLLQKFLNNETRLYLNEHNFLKFGGSFKRKLRSQILKMQNMMLLTEDFIGTFQYFQKRIKNEAFIPYYVKSMSILSVSIAKLLGMNDRDMIEQLVYTSFVHKIAYFKVPGLAEINSREGYEKIKDHFTLAEKELYFKGPKFAYEYAVKDKFSPFLGELILKDLNNLNQHPKPIQFIKERNINYSLCIFIFAKELFFYLQEHPEATIEDFLETSEIVNWGGAYQEICNQLSSLKTFKNAA